MANIKVPNGKPGVIVLGGCGFIGRNLVEYLIENDLVSYLRVIDKVPPQTAWLNVKHQKIFEHPLVEFKSANLINPISCQNAFTPDNPITYIFNCAGETKSGQTDPVYKEGIYKLSINCAQQAAKLGIEHYVEISSGNFICSEKMPFKEDDTAEPWTFVAKYKLQVENELKTVVGLKYTVLRPAIVYGPGDRNGLVIGALYKHLGEMMKLLWGPDLKMNTVHVRDVVRAMWHVATKPNAVGQIYNLVDNGNSTQGSISSIISEIFNINHDYWGNTLSSIAKMDMNGVVEEINDKHMEPWAEACNKDGVENTPLSPYIDQELLQYHHLHLRPGKLSENTGFTYMYPQMTKELLKQVLEDYVAMKIFPHSLV
ncbi:UDP-glucose 4-epimerase isoform X2 [Phymastichus coffea]|uniref:UDP-glucose 4-epimerase isoform X2 n=1 Tax=Phymastichus coffea TaxID=108790 RepID=UPI00273A846A|nr:UDP-glucose 4-epimerase isoform X2 [Phymastichus coffea]